MPFVSTNKVQASSTDLTNAVLWLQHFLRRILFGLRLQFLFLHHGEPLQVGAWPVDLSGIVSDPLTIFLAIANWIR